MICFGGRGKQKRVCFSEVYELKYVYIVQRFDDMFIFSYLFVSYVMQRICFQYKAYRNFTSQITIFSRSLDISLQNFCPKQIETINLIYLQDDIFYFTKL